MVSGERCACPAALTDASLSKMKLSRSRRWRIVAVRLRPSSRAVTWQRNTISLSFVTVTSRDSTCVRSAGGSAQRRQSVSAAEHHERSSAARRGVHLLRMGGTLRALARTHSSKSNDGLFVSYASGLRTTRPNGRDGRNAMNGLEWW